METWIIDRAKEFLPLLIGGAFVSFLFVIGREKYGAQRFYIGLSILALTALLAGLFTEDIANQKSLDRKIHLASLGTIGLFIPLLLFSTALEVTRKYWADTKIVTYGVPIFVATTITTLFPIWALLLICVTGFDCI